MMDRNGEVLTGEGSKDGKSLESCTLIETSNGTFVEESGGIKGGCNTLFVIVGDGN